MAHRARSSLLALAPVLLAACGVKEKLEQRVNEEIAEKVVEVAAGGEVDVEAHDGKVTIEGKDGQKVAVDGEAGTVRVTDEQGKVYDYKQDGDQASVKGSDGLDATMGAQIPEDFPLSLPKTTQVLAGYRVIQPDGAKTFSVSAELDKSAGDMAAVATTMQAALEAKGLTVERTEVSMPQAQMITLKGTLESAKIESSVVISLPDPSKGVNLMVAWIDKSGVTG